MRYKHGMRQEEAGRALREAFAEVPDRRARQGRRHPLPAVLALATAAMVSGTRSLYAMAQWGRLQPAGVVSALGFTRERTPSVSTLHEVFKTLDVAAFEAALARWGEAQVGAGVDRVAIDGKGLRGIHGEELPGARLVAVYAEQVGAVLAQAGGPVRGG